MGNPLHPGLAEIPASQISFQKFLLTQGDVGTPLHIALASHSFYLCAPFCAKVPQVIFSYLLCFDQLFAHVLKSGGPQLKEAGASWATINGYIQSCENKLHYQR